MAYQQPTGEARWANTDPSLHFNTVERSLIDWRRVMIHCLKAGDREAAELIHERNKPVEKASCDACGELKPKAGFKTVFVYGCEGDFCHDCRHGEGCDCGADDE